MCCPCYDSPLPSWAISNHPSCALPAGDPDSLKQDSIDQPRSPDARGRKRGCRSFCFPSRGTWSCLPPRPPLMEGFSKGGGACILDYPPVFKSSRGRHAFAWSFTNSYFKATQRLIYPKTTLVLKRDSGIFSTFSWGCQQVASQEAFVELQTISLILCLCRICTCWLLSRGRS